MNEAHVLSGLTILDPLETYLIKFLVRKAPTQPLRTLRPVTGPSVWHASDYSSSPSSYTYRFTADDVGELDRAVRASIQDRVALQDLSAASFNPHMPKLAQRLEGMRAEVLRGRGFQLLKGLPVTEYLQAIERNPTNKEMYDDCMDRVMRMYLGLGLSWGQPRSQNKQGDPCMHAYISLVRCICALPLSIGSLKATFLCVEFSLRNRPPDRSRAGFGPRPQLA